MTIAPIDPPTPGQMPWAEDLNEDLETINSNLQVVNGKVENLDQAVLDAQQAASDAEMFAGQTQTLQDSAVSTLINTPGTATEQALNATVGAQVAPIVPPLVADAISNDPTVAQEAAALAQSDAGLVRTEDERLAETREEDDVAYAVVFEDGKRTALEVRPDGAPTDWSTQLIAQRLAEMGYLTQGGSTGPTNVLFVTVDDMDVNGTSVFGGPAGLTPNLDAFAATGTAFDRAYGDCAVCMPARSSMMTGRHTFNHGTMAIGQPITSGVPLMPNLLKDRGYFTAILGKVVHYVAQDGFQWDIAHEGDTDGINNEPGLLGTGRDPEGYYTQVSYAIAQAKQQAKPFFLSVNLHDPHRPFTGSPQEEVLHGVDERASYPLPSSDPAIPVADFPDFLMDDEGGVARSEYQNYMASCRRADDVFGRVMDALDESGLADNTLVIFMSDHGMPFPFAKEEVYHHSTANPFILRWPGVTQPGTRVTDAYTNCQIDIMPTILDALNVPAPLDMDGNSLRPLIVNGDTSGRDEVHFSFHRRGGGEQFQMRGTVVDGFLYVWNLWSELGATKSDYHVLQAGSPERAAYNNSTDPTLVARRTFFQERQPEELYDLSTDPGCLNDLSTDPAYAATLTDLRGRLASWMVEYGDPFTASYTHGGA